MLTMTPYSVPPLFFKDAMDLIPEDCFRTAINQPTGNFFYDPWVIADEFKDTVWHKIYDSLPVEDKGEARIIRLKPGECYVSHSDIDDRYHLNFSGNNCYLIDLENDKLTPLNFDGIWWEMDAGRKHTAANFGDIDRYQMVVRKLITKATIKNPVDVKITLIDEVFNRRYIFDEVISPWLNSAFKRKVVKDFKGEDLKATMTIDKNVFDELKHIINNSKKFKIEVVNEK